MFSFGDKPRIRKPTPKTKETLILSSSINPYVYETVGDFIDNLRIRLNRQRDGLGDILDGIQANLDIDPRYSPTTINLIESMIQPYVTGKLFWIYEVKKGVCIYCNNYVDSGACDSCGAVLVSYDVKKVDDAYLNLRSGTSKQIVRFLGELQGNMNYSSNEWTRIRDKLDVFFNKTDEFTRHRELTKGILPGTSADMMRNALSEIAECNTDGSVYYSCIRYWGWTVFDFARYTNAYKKYIGVIDSWCGLEGVKMSKMFKYYWVSLIIGFDISRHYFRICNENTYTSMITIARSISRSRSVPIPQDWMI
jgi:hypothetical protein